MDAEIVSRAQYMPYSVYSDPNQTTMILDAAALANLEILENEDGGMDRGTLLSALDRCATSFGRRMLHGWLCHPLRRADDIIQRQATVRWFFERPSFIESSQQTLKRVKDLGRIIPRAHCKSITLSLFLDLLDSLELANQFIISFKSTIQDLKTYSPIDLYCQEGLRNSRARTEDFDKNGSFVPIPPSLLTNLDENLIPEHLRNLIEQVPDISTVLAFYGFDRIEARKENRITPVAGTNPAFDGAQQAIESAKEKLASALAQYKVDLKDNSISFHFSKTENYSIVVTRPSTQIPSTWAPTKAKAGNRYWAPEVLTLVQELAEAEADLSRASVGALMSCLDAFTEKGFAGDCGKLTSVVGQLDVLMGLARFSVEMASEAEVCLPEPFLCVGSRSELSPQLSGHELAAYRTAKRPFLDISTMKHPFVKPKSGGRFIPNSVSLGSRVDSPGILLVTGPNMGGKSTLLRQTCILIIMAQVGCLVPAESCRFTPVDRIFTRIGARDNIVGGQSTFMVELEETSRVLAQATSDSLVIMDELGRGTSTFDGYSIAYAVLRHFESQASRVLFSTHYHKLTQEFNTPADVAKVQQGHMACREEHGHMTFLYQLALGPCPNSFGLEVAAMAHIPHAVLTRASIMSDMFEVMVDRKAFHSSPHTHNDSLNMFSFFRLLKLFKTRTPNQASPTPNALALASSTQAQTFYKAEVARLWRQVRFVEAQSMEAPS
jgi:DNA mismatch repair protein MSH6